MFLSTHELEHGRHVARLHRRRRRRRRRRRAYAPTSNTASHDTHEKINPWVSFCSLIWVWGSTWRPSAAELRYQQFTVRFQSDISWMTWIFFIIFFYQLSRAAAMLTYFSFLKRVRDSGFNCA